jgi:hypothetical protein
LPTVAPFVERCNATCNDATNGNSAQYMQRTSGAQCSVIKVKSTRCRCNFNALVCKRYPVTEGSPLQYPPSSVERTNSAHTYPFEHNFSFESTSHRLVDTLDRVAMLVFLAATITIPSTTGPNATFAPANNKESNTMYNCNKHKRQ